MRIVPLLDDLPAPDPRVGRAIALLRAWDRRLDPGSAAAALFEVWLALELPYAVLSAVLPSQAAVDAVAPGDPTAILALLERPDRRLGRDPDATRDRLLLESLEAAIDRTETLLGLDWARWRWGRLHVARLEHPISPTVGARLRRRLDVGPVPVGGGSHTVGNTSYGSGPWPDGEAATRAYFEGAGGASFRQVVDVGRWDRSLVINSPGQSGDPGSPHYRDLIERWARNEPVPMLSSRRAVERAAERLIELRPG